MHTTTKLLTGSLLGLLLLAGCSPRIEHLRIDPATTAALRSTVPTYTPEQLDPGSFEVRAPLTATSCKNRLWDPAPSQRDAIGQLRVKAARLGASGLLNVVCEAAEGVSLNKSCWASLRCHAAAIVVASPERASVATPASGTAATLVPAAEPVTEPATPEPALEAPPLPAER